MSAGTDSDRVQALPLGLYVHLPWCVRKCPYCDFNSHRAPEMLPTAAYVRALQADLVEQAPKVAGRVVETVFFGGGTPSLFPPDAFAEVLATVAAELALAPDAEVTLEVNPGTVEHAPFDAYRRAGINRVSLGIQSFDDAALQRIGRIHGGREARDAASAALAAGFGSVNLDLMFALPEQSIDAAVQDVEIALALGAPHVSHYQLTIEPNTLFHARPPRLPDDEAAWTMQDACHARLQGGGLAGYEVSAWAKPGHACRHNLNYWTFGDYLGVGAGAHGKLTDPATGAIQRTVRQRHPRRYLEQPSGPGSFVEERVVPPADRLFEFALNVLRLREGVPIELISARTGLAPDFGGEPWATAQARGLLALDSGRLRPTALGWRYLNDLQGLFLDGPA